MNLNLCINPIESRVVNRRHLVANGGAATYCIFGWCMFQQLEELKGTYEVKFELGEYQYI